MSETKLCKYCKSIINKKSTVCEKCGKKLPPDKSPWWTYLIIAIFVLAVIGSIGNIEEDTNKNNDTNIETENNEEKNNDESDVSKELTESEYKGLCQEYNYKDVLRNPEQYIGEKIVVTLEISTVKQESLTNPTKYYFAYSESEPGSGFFYGDRYAVFDERKNQDELKILEDDIIKVWGEISEPQETSSLIVNSEELFCIDMKYAELISE